MEEIKERRIILERFLKNDRHLYRVGKANKLPYFDQFDERVSDKGYPELNDSERVMAIKALVAELDNRGFVESVNRVVTGETVYPEVDSFIGEHYFCNTNTGLKLENRQPSLADNIRTSIKNTDGRIIPFLKAITELYNESTEDTYEGYCLNDILMKMRTYGIRKMPDPVDLVIAKSYNFYYQVGGKKCPVHVIPEEMIPVVERVLLEYP